MESSNSLDLKKGLGLFFFFFPLLAFARFEQLFFQAPDLKTQVFVVREQKASSAKWQALIPSRGGYPAAGKSVAALAEQSKSRVAVNANFYREDGSGMQRPIGLVVHEGEILSEPLPDWPSAGFWKNAWHWDQVVFEGMVEALGRGGRILQTRLCRLNGPASLGCASLWINPSDAKRSKKQALRRIPLKRAGEGPRLGESVLEVAESAPRGWSLELPQNISPQPLKGISKVKLHLRLHGARLGQEWGSVLEAVSGSHVFSDAALLPPPAERPQRAWAALDQPRTVFGEDGEGRAFVAVFDGRRAESVGVGVKKAWLFLKEKMGARWMINFDGGGSSTLVHEGKIVNRPSDGLPRAIAVGLGAR